MHPADSGFSRLTDAQRAALQHVRQEAVRRQQDARLRLVDIVTQADCSPQTLDAAVDVVNRCARVVVHFHPDRIGVRSITVAEALLEDGLYRSQFETGHSAGGLTAFTGGDRDQWERSLFGGAYHERHVRLDERPKYGTLELVRFPDGPWPRFGSCYLVLQDQVRQRTSFTFAGSEQPDAAERLGTIDMLEGVLAPLLAEVASGSGARVPWPPFTAPTLGIQTASVRELLQRVSDDLALPRPDPATGKAGRVLDTGVEAQIHGPLDMAQDVERLVADPSFVGTSTGDHLQVLCHKYGIPLDWHIGFRLAAEDVRGDFRGPAIPALAQRIARDGRIDAAVIGAAQRSLRLNPDAWRASHGYQDSLQHLKQLWHTLVHFGEPWSSST